MIEETYCSEEVSKLLKEKGFNEPCLMCYTYDGKLGNYGHYNSCKNSDVFSLTAPTLQMAMKWLREVHNIFICILPSEVGVGVIDYTYVLYKIDAKNFYFENLYIQGRAKNISEISYEQTVESAIKYCLEHLI